MRWWVALLALGLGLSAAAQTALEDEAKQLTSILRLHDPYARVITADQFRISQKDLVEVLTSDITEGDKRTGYIKLKNFFPTGLCRDFRNELLKFKAAKVDRLILDLRGNPGGQRMLAVCIAGLLIGPKSIVGLKDVPVQIPDLKNWVDEIATPLNPEMQWRMSVTSQETEMPMALLINRWSASASEIVAGALRDYKRAWIVGSRSFGKGMAQEYVPMKDRPDLMVGYTIQQFFSPAGISPEGVGVSPTLLPVNLSECASQKTLPGAADRDRAYAEAVLDCGSP